MIEIYQDRAGGHRFRVKGGNGEIVASSESYTRRSSAMRGVRTLRDILNVPEMEINDLPPPAPPPSELPADTLQPGTVWRYKDARYQVIAVLPQELIQFEGEWRPTVRYISLPKTDLTFNRSDKEFLEKFERV